MPNSIRLLETVQEIERASSFLKSVWGSVDEVVPADIAIATGHAGGYFAATFSEDDDIIAASYAFVGRYGALQTLHSHVTASVVPGAGFELKMHQQAWASERGFDAITWTFDPLVRRNCVFNLEKLGATAEQYLVNFYGQMRDQINAGDESDRLLAVWHLSDRKAQRSQFEPQHVALSIGPQQEPLPIGNLDECLASRAPFAVYLPSDVETLRKSELSLALDWRFALRRVLNSSFASGAVIRQMCHDRQALLVEWLD